MTGIGGSPWVSIWTQPRKTIRQIVQDEPKPKLLYVMALVGVTFTLGKLIEGDLPTSSILLISIIAGPAIGILQVYFLGALLKWTGGWIGGRAEMPQVRAAVSWAQVPNIIGMLLCGPLFLIFRDDLAGIVSLLLSITLIALNGWTMIVSLKCLGEVQGFSAWKALGNAVLASLVVGIPAVIIIPLIYSFH